MKCPIVNKSHNNIRMAEPRQVVNGIVAIVVGVVIHPRKKPKGMGEPFGRKPSKCTLMA